MTKLLKTAAILTALAAPAALLAPAVPAFAGGGGGAPIGLVAAQQVSAYSLHGMTVTNDQGQPWGYIEDILLGGSQGPMAVVNVDKMAGHPKMVVVPLSHLKLEAGHMMMHGATKMMAEHLPAFTPTFGQYGA